MAKAADRILIVDDDPDVLDLLARQTLGPSGYETLPINNANDALRQLSTFLPDLIIVSLSIPGFSGKDLLVALQAQGDSTPSIVLADPGSSKDDLIDAFRLGAADYVVKPVREAELVSAVDRVMAQVNARRERSKLQRAVQEANTELEQRVRELTILFGIGKAVTNMTDTDTLFTRLVEATLYVTGAKMGWLLIENEQTRQLELRAARNVPRSVSDKINKPWHAGLGPLVMLSGEPLNIHGPGMQRFKVASMAKAALVVPILIREKPVGVLVVANDRDKPFTERHQAMLVAVADYASIAIVNMRLFQALAANDAARTAPRPRGASGEPAMTPAQLRRLRDELSPALAQAREQLNTLLDSKALDRKQKDTLLIANNKLLQAINVLLEVSPGR